MTVLRLTLKQEQERPTSSEVIALIDQYNVQEAIDILKDYCDVRKHQIFYNRFVMYQQRKKTKEQTWNLWETAATMRESLRNLAKQNLPC